MCEAILYSITYNPISCRTTRVVLFVLFFYLGTEVEKNRRGPLRQVYTVGKSHYLAQRTESRQSTTCTSFCFLSAVRLDPCHHPTRHPISQCHNGIIQVLWLSIIIMFQLRYHRETSCHIQPLVMTTWQTGVGGGPHLTAAHSVRQDMCQVTLYSTTYHTNSCQTSRVDLCVLFFLVPSNSGRKPLAKLFTETGHECR